MIEPRGALPSPPVSPLGPSVLVPVYVAIILIGYVIFHSGLGTINGNELSRQRSLFAAINAATLTGFAQSTNVNDYTPVGQFTAAVLIVAGVLFTLIAGGTAVCRIAGLGYSDRQIAGASLAGTAAAAAIGGVALAGDGRGIVGGAFDGLSAFGNCGLFLGSLPAATSGRTHLVLLPLAVVGGLGAPLLMELVSRLRGRAPGSVHARAVLGSSALIYLAGTVLLLLVDAPPLSASAPQWRHAVVAASTLSLDSRSAGFPFSFATEWSRGTAWIVMLLMFVGGSSGGTAGGLKVNTVGVLLEAAVDPWNRRNRSMLRLAIAVRWTLVYLGMIGLAMLVLLASEPQIPADRLLFLAVSGVGNVGLSHDPVVVSDTGWFVLSAVMLVGRLAPVLMLWWMADQSPEPGVAIG